MKYSGGIPSSVKCFAVTSHAQNHIMNLQNNVAFDRPFLRYACFRRINNCIVSFSILISFYVSGVYRGNNIALPMLNVVMGPAATCFVMQGFPRR